MRRIGSILGGLIICAGLVPCAWPQDNLVTSYAALSSRIAKARAAFRNNRLEVCEKEASFCLGKLPEHHEAHFLMSLILYKRGDYAAALEHIGVAERSYLTIARALALAGRQGLQNQLDAVIQATDELEELAGAYGVAKGHVSGLGEKYERDALDAKQDLAKAEGERNKAAAQADRTVIPALYRYWHGNIDFMLRRPAEAEAEYRQALSADPDFTDTYNNLINLLYSGGRVEEAQTVLAQAEAHKAKVHPGLKKAVLGQNKAPGRSEKD